MNNQQVRLLCIVVAIIVSTLTMAVQVGCAPAPTHSQQEIEAMAQQVREQEIADDARFVKVGAGYVARRVKVEGIDCVVVTGKHRAGGTALSCDWENSR